MTKTPKRSGDLADRETSKGERTPPTSGEGVANALDRWDEEGGAPVVPWPLPYEAGDFLDAERRVLECLGAALAANGMTCPPTFREGSSSTRRRENHMMLPY
jgi:hypothetical protein